MKWTTEMPKDDGVYCVMINKNSSAYTDEQPRLFVYKGDFVYANLNENGRVTRDLANTICTHWLKVLPPKTVVKI